MHIGILCEKRKKRGKKKEKGKKEGKIRKERKKREKGREKEKKITENRENTSIIKFYKILNFTLIFFKKIFSIRNLKKFYNINSKI